eukprot:scaffold65774_cov33-Attheya_sp.AAC.1
MGQQQQMALPNQRGHTPASAGTHPPDASLIRSITSYPDNNQYHNAHRDILETSDTTSIGTTITIQDFEQRVTETFRTLLRTMQEAIRDYSTTEYPADHHTQNTFEKAASASRGQKTNREDAISPATIPVQKTESHPTEYAPTAELVNHPVAKIFTHETTKINNPSPTLPV